jgi:hypothetical protein
VNTKQCIFCRKSPVTTEDIWGTWIGDYLGRREGLTTLNVYRVVIQIIGFWVRDTRLLGMLPPANFVAYQPVFWPITAVPIYWPPPGPSLDEPGVLALGATLRQNMPWIPLAY